MQALQEAIVEAGGISRLAERLGVRQSAVSNWLMRGVAPKPSLCAAIEKVTQGAVTVERLRPAERWVRVLDGTWPHALGRPCVDVSAVAGGGLVECEDEPDARPAAGHPASS